MADVARSQRDRRPQLADRDAAPRALGRRTRAARRRASRELLEQQVSARSRRRATTTPTRAAVVDRVREVVGWPAAATGRCRRRSRSRTVAAAPAPPGAPRMIPSARRPRSSIRSVTMSRSGVWASVELRGERDELRGRPGRAGAAVICSMIAIASGPFGHHAGPADVAGDDSGDAVAELLLVDEHLLAVGQQRRAARGRARASTLARRRAGRTAGAATARRARRSCGGCAATGSARRRSVKPCSRIQMISSWRRTRRWFAP